MGHCNDHNGCSCARSLGRTGWLSSLTGPFSSAAIAENQGVMFAVEEITKAGGILGRQVELLTRDTAGDPVKAVDLAQQLVFFDKVQFVIGPVNSGEALAIVPVLARAGVPNIHQRPAGHTGSPLCDSGLHGKHGARCSNRFNNPGLLT